MSSTSTPQQQQDDKVSELIHKLEKEGEKKVQAVKVDNKPISAETFLNIIKEGAEEFQETTGRPMTYAEMREAYG
jgi:oligoendopeptidase F